MDVRHFIIAVIFCAPMGISASSLGAGSLPQMILTTEIKQTPKPECLIDPKLKSPLAGNAGCLIVVDNKMLALQHNEGLLIGVPGGHAEKAELAQCTAAREVWEETGLTVTVGKLLNKFPNGFLLFDCAPSVKLSADMKLQVPPSGRNEITSIVFVNPFEVDAKLWRFPKQKNWYHEHFKQFHGPNVH